MLRIKKHFLIILGHDDSMVPHPPTPAAAAGVQRSGSERRKHPPTSLYIGGPDNAELEAYVRAQEAKSRTKTSHEVEEDDYTAELGHLR